jgi:copper chaperone CopZ
MSETTFHVTGMTCGHCVSAVSSQVGAVTGVESVAVDLETGSLLVTGVGVSDADVRAAVAEAGYTLV